MKKLLRIFAVVMVLTFALAGCGTKEDTSNKTEAGGNTDTSSTDNKSKEDNKLIVGTEAGFAPYEYMEGNKVVGVDMDIAKAIADSMGKELEIKNMEFDGALLAVQKGTIDLVAAGVSVNEERKKVMDFSIEYVDSTEVVVVNKANPMVTDPTKLEGKVVGVQQGNIADFYVEANCKAKKINRYTKFAQAAEDLKNGKIDCIVMDQYPADELVKANSDLSILDGNLFQDKYAIAVKKGNKELLDKVNAAIQKLKDEGKIEEFTANHMQK